MPISLVTALTALLCLRPDAPAVALRVVDGGDAESTPAEREQLHGLLALRMLDEGMAVAPAGTPAEISVELRVFAGRFIVRADAHGSHTSQVSRAEPATAELALCHGAMLAIAAVAPDDGMEGQGPPPLALALEIRGSNLSPSADALRLALVGQLLTRGWTLTAERRPDRPTLCVHDAGELVTVAFGPPERPCGSPLFFARRAEVADDATTRAHIVGAAVAMIEVTAVHSRLPATAFADEAREALGTGRPSAESPVEAPAPAPPARLGIELRAAVGPTLRAGLFEHAPLAVDPVFRLGLRLGRAPGLAGQVGGIVIPSSAGRSYRALDGFVGAGLTWSRRIAGRWEIELGSLLGVHLHEFRGPGSAPDGLRGAPWGELMLGGAWRTRRGLAIHAGLHPAASWTSGWVHYYIPSSDAANPPGFFQRSGWSVSFSLGLSHGWRLR